VSSHAFRLIRDVCAPGALASLGDVTRVVYVLEGELTAGDQQLAAGAAWLGVGPREMRAGSAGSTALRYELVGNAARRDVAYSRWSSKVLLEQPIDLDPRQPYLIRADRVDFDLGGVALPHGHRGGGIRCLIAGALEVTVGDGPPHVFHPGEAWFESGREPVLARASAETPTSFIRVAILPREIRGKSSIVYVNPEDAQRGRPRQYTVYVDEPIEI
jgi:quercetin dioxygenase-like cupin family protein